MYRKLQYLRYLWMAKTRHGVHSPFVFAFIERVLRSDAHKTLKERIMQYFDNEEVKWLTFEAMQNIDEIPANTIAVLSDIHNSRTNTLIWEQMIKTPSVTMSLDVFDYGILLFRPDFKEKQHFVVKG